MVIFVNAAMRNVVSVAPVSLPITAASSNWSRLCVIVLTLAALQARLGADWRDDIGYNQLAAELGAAMPNATGIVLLQSEANDTVSPPNYLPQPGGPGSFAGAGVFAGKTFYPESGAGVVLGHAQSVASNYYANGSGAACGATEIHNYTATDFLNLLYNGTAPTTFPGRVQNHSWIGAANPTPDPVVEPELLRRFDFMINRDGCIVAAALNNGTGPMPPWLGNNYHAITTGLRSGQHSQGGTNTDGSGRMKPDVVVNESLTSYAAPVVAGSGAVLLQSAVATGNASAQKPQVIKAQIIAAASKLNLPQWKRQSDATPYDAVFGAGELNLRNAYYIQQAGQNTYSTTAESPSRGWDYAATTSNAAGRRYFFSIPAGRYSNTFSAAVTWHRTLSRSVITGYYTSSMTNLNLKLYTSQNFAPNATPISTSSSSLDNVQHVFQCNLPPGQYLLEVTANSGGRNYGLAWDAQIGSGPVLTPRITGGQLFLDASNIDPQISYTIESSPDLANPWTGEQTFRTADTTPSFTFTWNGPTSLAGKFFYRLRWTPVR